MKISKERLKQIIKEELGMTENDLGAELPHGGMTPEPSLTAREAEAKNKIAFAILDDLRSAFVNASPDDVGTERERDDAAFLLMSSLKQIYNKYMSRLRNEDPEMISIRQANYPTRDFTKGDVDDQGI
jgi:hypothetical protein